MAALTHYHQKSARSIWEGKNMPENKSLDVYSESIVNFYRENNLDGILIMAVEPNESNIIDQEALLS